MFDCVVILGARPQIIKWAPLARALQKLKLSSFVIHTGQHHDYNLSDIFFNQYELSAANMNLGIAGGSHGKMTGEMLPPLEAALLNHPSRWVVVFGDTNSTLAGALVASKLHRPIAHIEAGLRSYNRQMPEEINRVVTDHLATLHFCPTTTAVENLAKEGILEGVHCVGDIMFEIALETAAQARQQISLESLFEKIGVPASTTRTFALVTVHRAENTHSLTHLREMVSVFERLPLPTIWPVHPRTAAALKQMGYRPEPQSSLHLTEPVGHLEMMRLLCDARLVLTDSGGLQKEAYFLGRPCLVLRDQTEWPETLEEGRNVLAGTHAENILPLTLWILQSDPSLPSQNLSKFGNGHTAENIAKILAAP